MEGLSAIINPVSLLMHLVNIVILYIVFRLLLYKPVAKFMKSRQERFAKEREELDAEKAEADAIRAQGDEILHKARSDAETQVAQIMAPGGQGRQVHPARRRRSRPASSSKTPSRRRRRKSAASWRPCTTR